MNYYTMSLESQSLFGTVGRIQSELSWWVKILTAKPYCIYYFGPFDSEGEAAIAQYGYIEDLMEEEPTGIEIQIKQAKPKLMTIYN